MFTRWKGTSGIYLSLLGVVLCGLITSCAPGLVNPTDPNSSLVIGRVVINNKHTGRFFGVLPLGTVDQGIEVEVESRDGRQYYKVTTEKQGYFFIPNMSPNTYQVRSARFEGTLGNERESYTLNLRRLNFTPVPGTMTYIGTLFIELSERVKSKKREVWEPEKARAYFLQNHGDSAWASRNFTTIGPGQVPSTQVAKKVETEPRVAKPATGRSVKGQKPEWKVGYWWEYAWQRPGRSGTRTYGIVREDTFEGVPTYVMERGRREYFYTKDTLGDIARIREGELHSKRTPPFQTFSWPLKVGKEWRNAYLRERPQEDSSRSFDHRLVVATIEEVKVPAGTFEAFKIQRYTRYSGNLLAEYWYSPKVKWLVKRRLYRRAGLVEWKLISFKVD